MRHFIYTHLVSVSVPSSPAAHALGVFMSALKAVLIAFTGLALSTSPGECVTLIRAVTLASVAVAAHQHLGSATSTKEHAGSFLAADLQTGIVHEPPRQTGMCWTRTVQKCHNRIALVSNTVKGAADGTNCDVRAAAAPAYSSVSPLLQRTNRSHGKCQPTHTMDTPNSNAAIKPEALGPLA